MEQAISDLGSALFGKLLLLATIEIWMPVDAAPFGGVDIGFILLLVQQRS